MKKIILLFLLFVSSVCLEAQSYIGFLTDNYSGVNSVIANPANITDSRFKTDINLIGGSVFAGNDYYGLNVMDAIEKGEDFDFELDAKKSATADNNLALNGDVMGPSFMFNLTKESSLAIFTRIRAFANINELNVKELEVLDNETGTTDFRSTEGDFAVSGHGWAEIGATYARVIINKEQHFLKGGLSLKYLKGLGSAYFSGKDLFIDYDEDGTDLGGGQTTGSLTTTGTGTIAYPEDIDNGINDEEFDFQLVNAAGFGADLGVVYEWRPDYAKYKQSNTNGDSYTFKDRNKYKLKLGLSLTDIGAVNYKEGVVQTGSINNTNVSEDDFDDIEDVEDIEEVLNDLGYMFSTNKGGYNMALPAAVHLNADWSLNRYFYLNLNTDLSLVSKKKGNASRISNMVSFTPRFESKWFSFYLPLNVTQYNGFQAGVGLRAGPLYLGSGSVLSVLTSDETRGADVYAGLKIPVYQGKPRDKDKDGLIDKLDKCPKEAGPKENNGCPWGDKDGDSILDNVDACPEEAGPKENKGCPWGDKDGDTVLDNVDECVDEPGVVENNGCPWKDTDGDGVFDKDDECVDVVGTVANNGCPEKEPEPVVTEEVQKTLNNYAKTILFNSGKSSIKAESNQVLSEIVKILKEYPSSRFSIEGHTDSVGSSLSNQKLSEARANSIKAFLVRNGIDLERLTSIGYGESKPVANNATKSGRAENRRVEINLIK